MVIDNTYDKIDRNRPILEKDGCQNRQSQKVRVRQGEIISTKLFADELERIFWEMNWEGMRVKINGEYLKHVHFSYRCLLIDELLEM